MEFIDFNIWILQFTGRGGGDGFLTKSVKFHKILKRMNFTLNGLIFKDFDFWILQFTGRGWISLDRKCENFILFFIESFLPSRLLIWAWNFHFICFEKFRVVVVGRWCTYVYNISLSPNLWITTFDFDLDLDLGWTIIARKHQFQW